MTAIAGRSDPFGPEQLPVTVNNLLKTAGSLQLMTGSGLIIAITALSLTATIASQFRVLDGTDSTGDLRAVIGAPAAGNASFSPADPGIPFRIGLYLEHQTGTMVITVTYIPFYQLP